jgi:hypothetical protein
MQISARNASENSAKPKPHMESRSLKKKSVQKLTVSNDHKSKSFDNAQAVHHPQKMAPNRKLAWAISNEKKIQPITETHKHAVAADWLTGSMKNDDGAIEAQLNQGCEENKAENSQKALIWQKRK